MNEIRSHDYVNHAYAAVRDALVKDPAAVLSAATNAAAVRTRDVAAALHVNLGPLKIGAEIVVTAGEISEQSYTGPISPVTRLPIEWSAAERAELFPVMKAELSVYPLTSTETHLEFVGRYEPPLGIVGGCARCGGGVPHRPGVGPSPHYRRREVSERTLEVAPSRFNHLRDSLSRRPGRFVS